MSQENVEIVRRHRCPQSGGHRCGLRRWAPDFEYDGTRGVGIDGGVFNLEEFKSLLSSSSDTWESFAIGADESDRRR